MHMSSQWERQDLNKCGSTRHKKLPHPDWIEIFGPYPDPLFVPTKIVTLSYKFGKNLPIFGTKRVYTIHDSHDSAFPI